MTDTSRAAIFHRQLSKLSLVAMRPQRHSQMLFVLSFGSLRYPPAKSNSNFDILNRLLLFYRGAGNTEGKPMRKPRQKGARVTRVLDSFAEFEGDKQFATTLARGLEILRCFTPEGPILGNKDLAERTKLPKPTVSRFTYTLSRLGYLKADHISSKYQLGPAVLAIGYPLLATLSLRQLARPAMKELADYAGGSVSMGIRDRLNIVYVETSRSNSMFSRQLSDIGLSQPIVATAIGRAYLAACAPADREAICNEIRIKTPEDWERHHRKVQQSLGDFEKYGFCLSWGDLRRDVHAVGVPLRRLGSEEIVVFNCALQSFLVKPGQIRADIGPRLAAMVRGLAAV